MKKLKTLTLTALLLLASLVLAGCNGEDAKVKEVLSQEEYVFVNPDATKADADAGFVIDGVLDEAAYQKNNWLYLHNEDGGNKVDIAMTSYFGEKGMYFVYDVTESARIFVNPGRNPVLNSCIEMYLVPSYLSSLKENSMFEIDMMPTGELSFRKTDGKYGYINVATTNDKMAVLGATTKGGEVNTPECYGYSMELFIPWEYMESLDIDVDAIRNGFVYINPAHITSNNYEGTNVDLDRYWYHYAQQNGAEFTNVTQYFRFNTNGVLGTVPVVVEPGENCTITAAPKVIPGMNTVITIQPDAGYAVTSVRVNGEEWIKKVNFNDDGSVTVKVRSGAEGIRVSAKAEKTTEGPKTISGKISLNNMNKDSLTGLVLSYMGPKGEKPLEIDSSGNFCLENLEQGYYVLKAEKKGYKSVNRSIYLNRNIETELILEYDAFTPFRGSCWILDDQNEGKLYKMGGVGEVMSNRSFNNFDYSLNLRFDQELAQQGNSDYFTQQRSGMRIEFSNGKVWHIDMLKENGQYILQYAKISGDNSLTNWKTIYKLNDEDAAKYLSKDGITLRIMRQGKYMAVWLNNKLHVIEVFGDEYNSCSAKLGMEAWITNRVVMEFPFRMSGTLPVDVAGSAFHWPAEIWDISDQYNGTITKHPAPGKDTWLDGKLNVNDVTTIAKDLTPEANDYSMIYIFKFSNGENFRVRLNHTDNDGKYRIQSFSGSTLFAPWKNHYTLTDAQAEKVKTEGIEYRVWIIGTTAYVFIDGEQVCSYDLSTVVATGAPSGIENATATISFRMDGNTVGDTVIPFKLKNNTNAVLLNIAQTANGTISAEKSHYQLGDTVKLNVTPAEGYTFANLLINGTPVTPDADGTYSFTADQNVYSISGAFSSGNAIAINIADLTGGTVTTQNPSYELGETVTLIVTPNAGYSQKLYIDDQPLLLDWKTNSYSFVAEKASYNITGSFEKSLDLAASDGGRWDTANQAHGILNTYYPNNTDSWWLTINGEYQAVSVIAKNGLSVEESMDNNGNPAGYQQILRMTLSNGKSYAFRLYNDKGTYATGRTAVSGSVTGWGGWKALSADAAAAMNGDGVEFKIARTAADTITVTVNGVVMDTYQMDGVTAADKVVSVGIQQNRNNGLYVEIPFALTVVEAEPPAGEETVALNIPAFTNGKVIADKANYELGETVVLTVTPNSGYCQKLYINGAPLVLDWKSNTYSFVAEKESYNITGSFEKSLSLTPSDEARWDASNQAHGIVKTYYPNNTDSWWLTINGEYQAVSVIAKNGLSVEESMDNNGNPAGYQQILRMTLSNGKSYAFRLYNDKGTYATGRTAVSGSVTGWGGWKALSADAAAAMNGDGVEFKIARTAADTITVTVNGVVVDTYQMDGVTAADKVVSVGIQQNRNNGLYVEIPFAVEETATATKTFRHILMDMIHWDREKENDEETK